MEKIFQPCEVKRPVRLRILSVTSFTSEYDFSQNILCTTMQGVSITILTPKDNNNFFIDYYIKSFHRLPPPPPLGRKLTLSPLHKGGNYKGGNYKRCKRYPSLFLAPKDNKVNPLAHTKAETTRITFL